MTSPAETDETDATSMPWSLKIQLTFLAATVLFSGLLVVRVAQGAPANFEGPVSSAAFNLMVSSMGLMVALVMAWRPGRPDLRPYVAPSRWPRRRELAFAWLAAGVIGGALLFCLLAPETPARGLAVDRLAYLGLVTTATALWLSGLEWTRMRMARWLLVNGHGLDSLTRLVPQTPDDVRLLARLRDAEAENGGAGRGGAA